MEEPPPLPNPEPEPVAAGPNEPPPRPLWQIAAVLALILIVGAVGYFFLRPKATTTEPSKGLGVNPTPVATPTGPIALTDLPSKMGVATGVQLWDAAPAKVDSDITGIAGVGAKWVRTSLHWKDVEATAGATDDWSQADRIVADAQKSGLSVIFDVDGTPSWAGGQQHDGEYPNDPQLYANFLAKVAARYRGRVRVYELGNEPNHVNYSTNPDPAYYAKLLKLTYPAIKTADPNALVLTGGIGGVKDTKGDIDPVSFAAALYSDGAKGYFDAMAYHPYTYPELPTQEVSVGDRGWSRMLSVRSAMVANGDGAKQIWVTEFGAPTDGPGGVSEQQQAAILQNGFNLWQSYSWGGVICWFDYQDKGNDSSTHKDWFGLISASGSHKPSYDTYAALSK